MGLIDSIAGYISNERTNEANAELMAENREWQEQMQDKQNEYNTPLNQLRRLREAGIAANSSLIPGSSSVTQPSAGVGSSPVIPYQDPFTTISNGLSSLGQSNLFRQQAKTEQTTRDARLEQIKNEAEQFKAQTGLITENMRSQQIANKYADSLYQWELNERKSRFHLNYAQKAKADKEVEELVQRIYKVVPQQIRNMIAEEKLNIGRLDEVVAATQDYYANIEYKKALEGLTEEQQKLVNQQWQTEYWNTEKTGAESMIAKEDWQSYSDKLDLLYKEWSATINKIQVETGLTEQESEWFVFKTLMGSKVGEGSSVTHALKKFVSLAIKFAK